MAEPRMLQAGGDMNKDPRRIILESPMSRFQIIAIAITIGLNALDGFDVLSISFASPGIAKEWGIDRAALGFVLSMELIGMAMGSILLGGFADRRGRRPAIIGCLAVMSTGMLMSAMVQSIVMLSFWRLLTGVGIGGMLASINAMTAEYSNNRRRDLAVALMAVGYPIGAVIGGSVAALLLKAYDWRAVFLFGAAATALFLPLVWWRMPESIEFLVQKRPPDALARINKILARMGHEPVPALPDPLKAETGGGVADIFRPGLIGVTLAVTAAYFLHITNFYFVLKWTPKIVADMGFTAASAAGVLVWANVGGATGGAVLGLLSQRIGIRTLTVAALLMSAVMVAMFGRTPSDLHQLALASATAGFFTNASVVGLYAIVAKAFPTHVRASGTGFVIGVGRGGSALAPIIAGALFQAGMGLALVSLMMAAGSLLAAISLLTLKLRDRPAPVAA